MQRAHQAAVDKGIAFAVAAGNSNADASGFSPGGFDNVLSVSALADFDGLAGGTGASTCRSDQDDTLADFSNWGTAVDITAPGVCILSTYPVERGGYGTISGTSMASPHVAGALALLASTTDPGNASDVRTLYDTVVKAGNYDWTDDSGDGVTEPLLDVTTFSASTVPGEGGSTGGSTDNTKPVVTISSPAEGEPFTEATSGAGVSISFTGTATDNGGDVSASITWSTGSATFGAGAKVETTLSAGTHVVTATVTDAAGNIGTASVTVTVNAAPPSTGISLSVLAYKVKGEQYADLNWTGAATTNVDIYIDGVLKIEDTPGDGAYTHTTGAKGGGSVVYEVCDANTTNCSAPVTAVW